MSASLVMRASEGTVTVMLSEPVEVEPTVPWVTAKAGRAEVAKTAATVAIAANFFTAFCFTKPTILRSIVSKSDAVPVPLVASGVGLTRASGVPMAVSVEKYEN